MDGWRTITVTDRRTTEDGVRFMWAIVGQDRYADVDCIRVVLDNLNTDKPAAFNGYFGSAEARRILDTLEFHFVWFRPALPGDAFDCQELVNHFVDADLGRVVGLSQPSEHAEIDPPARNAPFK